MLHFRSSDVAVPLPAAAGTAPAQEKSHSGAGGDSTQRDGDGATGQKENLPLPDQGRAPATGDVGQQSYCGCLDVSMPACID